jgi:hypothetical protein
MRRFLGFNQLCSHLNVFCLTSSPKDRWPVTHLTASGRTSKTLYYLDTIIPPSRRPLGYHIEPRVCTSCGVWGGCVAEALLGRCRDAALPSSQVGVPPGGSLGDPPPSGTSRGIPRPGVPLGGSPGRSPQGVLWSIPWGECPFKPTNATNQRATNDLPADGLVRWLV